MIITLMFIALIIIGTILVLISKNTKLDWDTSDNLHFIGFFIIAIGIIVSVVMTGLIIGNAATYDLYYQDTLHKKEMLEYRIEHIEENITGNEMLYNDIVEFNNELRSVKKWADNPWTNWFNNKDVAAIDYIEIDGE